MEALLGGWIDVSTAQASRVRRIEHCVGKSKSQLKLPLMQGQILQVLLFRHICRRPSILPLEDTPQVKVSALHALHDSLEVEV